MKIEAPLVIFLTSSLLSATAQHVAYDPKDFYKIDPKTQYVSLHLDEFVPTAAIRRSGPVSTLAVTPMPAIGQVSNRAPGSSLTLDEYLRQSGMQGIIVVHQGKIVYERYAGMTPADKHLYFSISKIIVSAIIGILEAEGK